MRIISGKYRGKKIFIPKDSFTRPLRDLVKESIFGVTEVFLSPKHLSALKPSMSKKSTFVLTINH